MQNTRNLLLTPVAACLCAGFAVSAQAQILDELEWRQEGSNAIVLIEFVTPVQYTKSITSRATDLVQVFYNVLPTRESINLTPGELRLAGGGGLPSLIVRDESDNATSLAGTNRKLVINFGAPTRFTVRPGRHRQDRSSIELVLEGLGEAVAVAAVKTTKVLPLAVTTGIEKAPTSQAGLEAETAAAALMATAQSAFDGGQYDAATETLNKLLNLPPNNSSRKAQELAGLARLNAGDNARAASEFGLFLKLYPEGADSDRIKQLLTALPVAGASSAVVPSQPQATADNKAVTSGSLSSFYFTGFLDDCGTDVTGAPCKKSTGVSNRTLQTSLDFNWRLRDTEKDMRFVLRDAYTTDYLKSSKSKEKLSALYFDYKSMAFGGNIRVGRQSPGGGGVMSRFDGVQAGYVFKPKWKVNAVVGKPTDDLLSTSRSFYGVSVDAEALTKELSGSAYLIEQTIDGETDRRALGADLRYFKGGISASGQLDYDQSLKKVNIAAMQSTWQITEATVLNAMIDRRTMPIASLSNAFFYDLITPAPQNIQEILKNTPSLDAIRDLVNLKTPYQNQFRVGGTTTLSPIWQVGGDFSLTNTDLVPRYTKPDGTVVAAETTSSGNMWGVSAQLIGTNLYSARDTHVFNLSFTGSLTEHTTSLSYNNLTSINENWQIEPTLRYSAQNSFGTGQTTDRWVYGARAIYRVQKQVSLESELTFERSKTVLNATETTTSPLNFYIGARYEF